MANKIHHFKGFSIVDGDIRIKVNMDRFSEQFNRAQYYLDEAVLLSCIPLMPFQSGVTHHLAQARTGVEDEKEAAKHLIGRSQNENRGQEGSGRVVFPGPYARFLYYGKVMVDEETGSPWARAGGKKVTTERDLQFNGAPTRGAFWFDRAKERDGKNWIRNVKKIAGGGNVGR